MSPSLSAVCFADWSLRYRVKWADILCHVIIIIIMRIDWSDRRKSIVASEAFNLQHPHNIKKKKSTFSEMIFEVLPS